MNAKNYLLRRFRCAFAVGILCVAGAIKVSAQNNYTTPYTVTTLAGSAGISGKVDGAGDAARFFWPGGVAVDDAGVIYVGDTANHAIRKITPSGVVTTLAGGQLGRADGAGTAAQFWSPQGVAVDGAGNVYVADYDNSRIRKITATGQVSTVPGTDKQTGVASGLEAPTGVAVDRGGNLYVSDINHTIYKISPAGVISNFAGTALQSGFTDGVGAAARFYYPFGLAVDSAGNVYVADTDNYAIRKITPDGVVTTLAGGKRGSVDGTGSVVAFNTPKGVAVDDAGNVYVAEGYAIRRVTPVGVVTTLAGDPEIVGHSADGTGAAAWFNQASGVAVDRAGVIYVADSSNSTIRKGVPPASIAAGPNIIAQPQSQTVSAGANVTLNVAAGGSGTATYQWQQNGAAISGAAGSTLTLTNVQPLNAGLYTAVATNSTGAAVSDVAIVGVATASKVVGSGSEIAQNIFVAANGNTFDQVLLDASAGGAATVTADFAVSQITRTSFVDLTNDIVQVEFSGHGTLTMVLDNPTGPALPVNYVQSTLYMKGHVGIVIAGADETTNVSVFSVGRQTAVNQALFKSEVTYDGLADLSFIAISSTNGKFGGLRAANGSFYATKGFTGVYAPGVAFQGPVFIGDISAADSATPVIIIGSSPDTRVTGGDLLQANGQPVKVAGLTALKFTAGGDSHGNPLAARTNRAVLQQNGVDVTAQIVVNP